MPSTSNQPMHLRDRIRTIRRQQKISQEVMAESLNICQASYARKERGETMIDIDLELPRILSVLRVSLADICRPM